MKEEMKEKVIGIITKQLAIPYEQVTENASFVDDLGADSLDMVEMIMNFEEEFNIEVTDEDAEKIKTVGNLFNYIDDQFKDKYEEKIMH